ncbi:MAG: DUF4442 domain-containing protein [Neisseriaceae bacterium]
MMSHSPTPCDDVQEKQGLTSAAVEQLIPFTKTAGAKCEKLTPEEVVVFIENRREVQNHIAGIHACATALAAETATGLVTNFNCPDDKLILLKELRVKYTKIATGGVRATAVFTKEMSSLIASEPRGSFLVPVTVRDEAGIEPVKVEATWAWIPK